MQVINLGEKNSIANQFVAELRNVQVQTDRQRFRANLEKLGSIMAYEISKTLAYQSQVIQTPLAQTQTNLLQTQPILITVLRAGLPYFQGFQNFFDSAPAGFIGAYQWKAPETGRHYLRMAFAADPVVHYPERALDDGIVRAIWLTPEELASEQARHRSPLVWRVLEDYLAGQRHSLSLLNQI